MYKVGDVRRRAQKRLQRRIIGSAVIIGVIVLAYFLVYKTGLLGSDELTAGTITSVKNDPENLQSHSGIFDTSHMPENEIIIPKDSPVVTIFGGEDRGIKSDKGVQKEAVSKNSINRAAVVKWPEDHEQPGTSANTKERLPGAVYEVVSEAFFYNKPDEHARSEAYISYWNNSNGSIRSLREKNGFVYVECKDNLGQTARGWLRKKDLKRVNTAYEDTKE